MNPTMNISEQKFEVFCSHQGLDIFHPVTHQNQIWRPDPYDIETIHQEARFVYERFINRVDGNDACDSGRILLLLGESGAGKTHLMRVFRNQIHEQQKGFFSYMQMTTQVSNYARYVLRNTIDSFDKPYYTPFGVVAESSKTGLMLLSNALAETSQVMTGRELELLREGDLNREELLDLIYPVADRVVTLDQFSSVDLDLIRALLYLQPGQPALNNKVFKLLRCEPLTEYDSRMLGGMKARDRDDDPLRMLQSLALLIQAVTGGAFVICLDQLEEINSMDDAGDRFRRAIQTVVTLAEIPNVVVVISCLGDLYNLLKTNLPKSHIDRLELDPIPEKLKATRTEIEIQQMLTVRLQNLYDSADISSDEPDLTYPFPKGTIQQLSGKTTRDVLEWCRYQREHSITTGEYPKINDGPGGHHPPDSLSLSQYWNDCLTEEISLPEDDNDLLQLLGESIQSCSKELGDGCQFLIESEGSYLSIDVQLRSEKYYESLLLGMCQKSARGGALSKQIRTLVQQAGQKVPVMLRTTDFPSNPQTKIARQIGEFISNKGRRSLIADSDWRAMIAIQTFQQQYGDRDDYQQWLQAEQPLTQLPSLQSILNLKELKESLSSVPLATPPSPSPSTTTTKSSPSPSFKGQTSQPGGSSSPAQPSPYQPPVLPQPDSSMSLGQTRTMVPKSVDLAPSTLVRHGAFLGGSGSGKTTLALALIEQLLLRGIPAILLDRKGDLCSYANPEAWEKACANSEIVAYRQLLQENIDVAVYTPGTIGNSGRSLSIAVTPPGLGQLPSSERQQLANYCATALGGILNYKQSGQDKMRIAILGQAIAVLSELQPNTPLNINRLMEFIAEEDPLLVNAIGYLDPKHCAKLVEHLQTLSLMQGNLFSTDHELLSVEQLLSRSSSQRTPLSIINLGSLGDNANILFWVSQFLLDLNRYAQKNPSGTLQGVVLFDEADLYLPAQGKPSTKEPMENLLKRARSAGLGILLATQSPGDLDYRCRDQISSWFVGKVKENTALNKLKPMLSEAKVDVSSKLANQKVGEFFLIRAGEVVSLKANMSLVRAEQVPIERILDLAASSYQKS